MHRRLLGSALPFLGRAVLVAALGAVLGASCASVKFERESPTAGTFDSTAWAFTFLGFDFPSAALGVARGNASDSGLPNLVILEQSVVPRLGPLDWLLDIIMVRRAHISGTWGHPEEAPQAP